ncbi:MAG: hypothetical protein JJ902_14760 [Roseibium sp.]|nr:hypothetical protein [Roseibium sp.]
MSAVGGRSWTWIAVSAVISALLVVASYFVWTEANALARMFARGTVLTDLRFFIGFLAIFIFLSIADRLIGWAWRRFGPDESGHD